MGNLTLWQKNIRGRCLRCLTLNKYLKILEILKGWQSRPWNIFLKKLAMSNNTSQVKNYYTHIPKKIENFHFKYFKLVILNSGNVP